MSHSTNFLTMCVKKKKRTDEISTLFTSQSVAASYERISQQCFQRLYYWRGFAKRRRLRVASAVGLGSRIHTGWRCSVAASRRLLVDVGNGRADGDRHEDEQPRDPDHRPDRCHSRTTVGTSSSSPCRFISPDRVVVIPDDLEKDLPRFSRGLSH